MSDASLSGRQVTHPEKSGFVSCYVASKLSKFVKYEKMEHLFSLPKETGNIDASKHFKGRKKSGIPCHQRNPTSKTKCF